MSVFYRKSACNGVSPVSQSLKVLYKRDHLMHRLLVDRSKVRLICAPPYFGKTSLMAQYAKEVYSFRNVFWIDASSPEFLCEIDKDGFYKAIKSMTSNKSLLVIQNLPTLDNERLLRFHGIVNKFITSEWEVLISVKPECSFFKEIDKSYSVIYGKDLLLTASEVSQLDDADLQLKYRNSMLSDCFKIPGFCWSDVKHTGDLLEQSVDDSMVRSRFAVLFISAVLQKFSYSDLQMFFKDGCIPVMHDITRDYPFVCLDDKAGSYECYPFEISEIKKAFSSHLSTILDLIQFSHVDELIRGLADWLMASKDYKRASKLVAEFMTCERAAVWYAENSENLFLNVCILDFIKFIESTQIKNPDIYSALYSQQSLNLALIHEYKKALECGTKVLNYKEYDGNMTVKASLALDQCSLINSKLASANIIKMSQQGEGWKVFEELKILGHDSNSTSKRLTKRDATAILRDIVSNMKMGQYDLAYFKWVTLSDLQSSLAYDLVMSACKLKNGDMLEVMLLCGYLRRLACDKKVSTDLKYIREQRRLKARKTCGTIAAESIYEFDDVEFDFQMRSDGQDSTSDTLRGLLREYSDDHSFLSNELTLEESFLVDELVGYLNRSASAGDFNLLHVLVLAEVINLLSALRADDAPLIKFMHDYELQIEQVLSLIERTADDYTSYAYTKAVEALAMQRGEQVVKMGDAYGGRQSVPQLYIKTFGEFEMSIGGERVGADYFKRRKAQSLLSLLIVANGREVSRNDLILTLWPDSSYKSGERGFYSLWSELRTLLGVSDASCPYITRTQFGCKAQMDCLISDYNVFEEACESLVLGKVPLDGIPDVLATIENMYQGEFMPSDTEITKINTIRTECDRMRLNALVFAAETLISEGRVQQGLWYANRAYSIDRTREDICLTLMKALVGCGQRSNALDVYMELRKYLINELGIETSKETDSVYDGIINSRSNALIIDSMRGGYQHMLEPEKQAKEKEDKNSDHSTSQVKVKDESAISTEATDSEKNTADKTSTKALADGASITEPTCGANIPSGKTAADSGCIGDQTVSLLSEQGASSVEEGSSNPVANLPAPAVTSASSVQDD